MILFLEVVGIILMLLLGKTVFNQLEKGRLHALTEYRNKENKEITRHARRLNDSR